MNRPNIQQIAFILLIVAISCLILGSAVVWIHGSFPNLTAIQALNDCTREIVGNCHIK